MRRVKHRLLAAGGAAWALAALLGLASPLPTAAAATTTDAATQKVLRYAFESAETGFDPAQISDIYSANVVANIFEAPLRYAWLAPPGTLEPATLASMPEVSDDFRTFTFTLKRGIYFADDPAFGGRPRELVAEDYVYSLKRIADPHWKSPNWSDYGEPGILGLDELRAEAQRTGRFDYDRPIAGLQALDRYRFRIRVAQAAPRLLLEFARPAAIGAVAREVVERYGDQIPAHPVGTGPYRLVEWRRSSFIALERNPRYRAEFYDAHPGPADAEAVQVADRLRGRRLPMIDRIEISPIEESQPRWLAFLNGEHNLMSGMPRDLSQLALPGGEPSVMLRKKHIRVRRQPENDVAYLVYNMEDSVIGGLAPDRVALRRALNLGLDVDAFIDRIYKHQAFPAQSTVMPGTYGYDPSLHSEFGDQDPARANALLDVMGFHRGADGWRTLPDGSSLELRMRMEPDQRSRLEMELLTRSFRALGLRIAFDIARWPENLRLVESGRYQIWFLGWTAVTPDSEDAVKFGYGPSTGETNLSRMHLPEYDRLYDEARQLPDGPQRLQLLRRLLMLQMAYAPLRPIVHRYRIDLAYPVVVGFRTWPFIRDWWRYVDIEDPPPAEAR